MLSDSFTSLYLLSEPEQSVSTVAVQLQTAVHWIWCSYAASVPEHAETSLLLQEYLERLVRS